MLTKKKKIANNNSIKSKKARSLGPEILKNASHVLALRIRQE